LTATAHLDFPPFPDFLDRAVDIACRGDDRSLQPVRILPAKIRHMAMEGADHPGFERDVVNTDQARPAAGHEEMHVGPLVVHIGDAVGGVVVLHAGTRHLRAHPHRVAAAVVGPRRRLAENPAIELRFDAISVQYASIFGRLPHRRAVGFQFPEARAEVGIDIALDDFRRRQHMRIGVEYLETVFHSRSPLRLLRQSSGRSCGDYSEEPEAHASLPQCTARETIDAERSAHIEDLNPSDRREAADFQCDAIRVRWIYDRSRR
jgi:hypothetical protein